MNSYTQAYKSFVEAWDAKPSYRMRCVLLGTTFYVFSGTESRPTMDDLRRLAKIILAEYYGQKIVLEGCLRKDSPHNLPWRIVIRKLT